MQTSKIYFRLTMTGLHRIQIPVLAPSQLLSRLLSSKNDPVIKYACMQIRVLLCTESGTTVSLNWNKPVIN